MSDNCRDCATKNQMLDSIKEYRDKQAALWSNAKSMLLDTDFNPREFAAQIDLLDDQINGVINSYTKAFGKIDEDIG